MLLSCHACDSMVNVRSTTMDMYESLCIETKKTLEFTQTVTLCNHGNYIYNNVGYIMSKL